MACNDSCDRSSDLWMRELSCCNHGANGYRLSVRNEVSWLSPLYVKSLHLISFDQLTSQQPMLCLECAKHHKRWGFLVDHDHMQNAAREAKRPDLAGDALEQLITGLTYKRKAWLLSSSLGASNSQTNWLTTPHPRLVPSQARSKYANPVRHRCNDLFFHWTLAYHDTTLATTLDHSLDHCLVLQDHGLFPMKMVI